MRRYLYIIPLLIFPFLSLAAKSAEKPNDKPPCVTYTDASSVIAEKGYILLLMGTLTDGMVLQIYKLMKKGKDPEFMILGVVPPHDPAEDAMACILGPGSNLKLMGWIT